MRIVFMVAEKPLLAESIAKTLSHKSNSSRRGFNDACSIHEWTGLFRDEQVRFKMTSVCGHVMALDFPSRYNNWDNVDPAELFIAPIEKKEANPKLKMTDFLRHEAKNASILILWLDCDKEGENICFEVINIVTHVMLQPRQILRAHFSAVTEQELFYALHNLREPNLNESLSVDARQELDLRIGCAFTRFQTKFFQGKYGDLNSNLVSYGPCQTPTLGFCVQRHDRIQSFKPEPFWRLKASLKMANGPELDLCWSRDRIFDKEVATMFLNSIKGIKTATVVNFDIKPKVKSRPQGLNTVEMLKVASASLGMGPHNAMAIAERLYTSGFINYPRTESTAYPSTFDLKGLLKKQTASSLWGDIASELLSCGINAPRSGHDAGDHPPIAPMRLATSQDLSHDAFKLYQFIAQHFIATLMPDCRYDSTQVTLSIGDELFILTGIRVTQPGFTRILTWQAIEDTVLPESMLKPGSQLDLMGESVLGEGQTGPPDFLTEAELITAMEKHGIGTDASIPTHIENIVQRAYVELLPGRKLKPTNLGIVLVHGYQAIDSQLVLPHMRKAVEEQLNHIAQGRAQFDAVVQFVLTIFSAKYRYFVEHIQVMDQLFEVSFSNLSSLGKSLTRCGKCHRYLKLIDSRPQRLHCPTCNETYTVPQNGIIRPYKTVTCPLDGFELVFWSQGTKGKSLIFCPYCYSHPPFDSMPKLSGCNNCPHPSCPHALTSNGVDACLNCSFGILVLDDLNAPKYRLICNRCQAIVLFSDAVKQISIDTTSCPTCTAMHLNLKIDETKLNAKDVGDIGSSFSGCVFCSEFGCTLLTLVKAQANNTNNHAQRNSRGGNSGGRGRGRGRGQSGRSRRTFR